MRDMRLLVLPLLVALALASVACAAESEPTPGSYIDRLSFELDPGVHGHLFTMETGSQLELEFESDSEVDLKLLDPGGREVGRWEQTVRVDKRLFEAESAGQYKLEMTTSSLEESERVNVSITMQVFPPGEG